MISETAGENFSGGFGFHMANYGLVSAIKIHYFRIKEWDMYGTTRIGVKRPVGLETNTRLSFEADYDLGGINFVPGSVNHDPLSSDPPCTDGCLLTRTLGKKEYEFTNHLGNVLVTVSDVHLPEGSAASHTVSNYVSDVVGYSDYYVFGSAQSNRFGGDYRYDFNGKETDAESGVQDYGMRIYNTALGKFLSVDPLAMEYPWYTPYQFAGNKPVWAIDLDGLEERYYTDDLSSNWGFLFALSVANNTTAGKHFKELFASQDKYNIYFYTYVGKAVGNDQIGYMNQGEGGQTHVLENEDDERAFNKMAADDPLDSYNYSKGLVRGNIRDGKGIIMIGINSYMVKGFDSYAHARTPRPTMNQCKYDVAELALTIVHEEVAHAQPYLEGKTGKSDPYGDHLRFHGDYSYDSPSMRDAIYDTWPHKNTIYYKTAWEIHRQVERAWSVFDK